MNQIDIKITINGEQAQVTPQAPAPAVTGPQRELAEDALKEVRLLVGEDGKLLTKAVQPVKLHALKRKLERLLGKEETS